MISVKVGVVQIKYLKIKPYNNHFKSQKHIKWENNNMIRNYKESSTDYENKISGLRLKLRDCENEILKLRKINNKKIEIISYYIKNFVIIQIILLLKYS